jgi:hypothetical protein
MEDVNSSHFNVSAVAEKLDAVDHVGTERVCGPCQRQEAMLRQRFTLKEQLYAKALS